MNTSRNKKASHRFTSAYKAQWVCWPADGHAPTAIQRRV